ncbi:MAG TPA: hypothetical protein VHR84_19810 [Terriglobales bacterium]|nr:hypothetical protein [Terriglobales bacterium]
MGGLLIPDTTAVTTLVPAGPGVHTIGEDKESHFPAHAAPEFAIVSTSGLLEMKVVVILVVMT